MYHIQCVTVSPRFQPSKTSCHFFFFFFFFLSFRLPPCMPPADAALFLFSVCAFLLIVVRTNRHGRLGPTQSPAQAPKRRAGGRAVLPAMFSSPVASLRTHLIVSRPRRGNALPLRCVCMHRSYCRRSHLVPCMAYHPAVHGSQH